MSLPVADGSGTHGMDGPIVLIADRHTELACTYGGSDIYQLFGVIKCDHTFSSEYPDLTNFEKIIAIITANIDSITSQAIAHSHSGERYISNVDHGVVVGNRIAPGAATSVSTLLTIEMSGLRMSSDRRALSQMRTSSIRPLK